ncbi:MAG TPA: Re/Si-specific NAD(P)(+) transhydrogenase subunit alpha [Thermoanaerobaculia bacterium]|nr:Re/Si-specific NAD(P)(+) transhydrogenase subunit alpha [Thermoanaerobaculia bacterium]
MAKVLVPKERRPGETRVAATPETVKKMVKEGLAVAVERGAGDSAFFPDAQYEAAGAAVVATPDWAAADVVLKVGPLEAGEALRSGGVLIAFLAPHRNLDMVRRLVEGNASSLALELVPRITRAQGMDALSSQASIGGYKAVLLAAVHLPKYLPLLMTAAGTIKPAKVIVMGAGVAGLQAIGTARRLGAVVEVSDVRPAVKEQVESLGGRFIQLPMLEEMSGEGTGGYARQMGEDFLVRQREIVRQHLTTADAAITTALVPGKPAPLLLTRDMVEAMRPGSVIVDLAIEQGGNCELSEADREIVHDGVRILAPSNLPATMPQDASTLYARNVLALLLHIAKKGELALDPEDEIVRGTLLTHAGRVVHGPTAELLVSV